MAPLPRRIGRRGANFRRSKYKAEAREKVSIAAALWLPPSRDRLHLAYQTLVNGYFTNVEVAELPRRAPVQGSPGSVIAALGRRYHAQGRPDSRGGGRSRAPGHRALCRPTPRTLMPVEFLWRWLKFDRLCNFAPSDAHHLNAAVVRELEAVWYNPVLLTSFFHQSDSRSR